MKGPAALFSIVTLGAMILLPRAGAPAQDVRGEGPTEIKKCQTISQPGSYKLVSNLQAGLNADCLVITANFVTIDLAGFSISGSAGVGDGILASTASPNDRLFGITVRNGSLSGFVIEVNLSSAVGSIVEGLHVFEARRIGIIANGIVRGNTAMSSGFGPGGGPGIEATGIITGNYVTGSRGNGIQAGEGSTVIGNTATGNTFSGIVVDCPSNVTDNTAVGNIGQFGNPNLDLSG